MAFFGKLALTLVGITMAASAASAQTDWKDRFTFGGDLRARYNGEWIAGTGAAAYDQTVTDWRPRVRARVSMAAKINDEWSANFRFATGGSGLGSARSSNATLTNFGAHKEFALDLGYIEYKPMDGLALHLGKNPNPFWRAGNNLMLWNSESSLEGVDVRWLGDMGTFKPYVTVNYADMLDRSQIGGAQSGTNGPDVWLFGAQIGTKVMADPFDMNIAVGSYNYSNIKGLPVSTYSGYGNTLSGATVNANGAFTAGTIANDFALLEGSIELNYNLGFAPLSTYYSYVQNSEADNDEVAMIAGIRLGKLKDQGSWTVAYSYRDVGADAVFGIQSDSSFLSSGVGGLSGSNGHETQIGYQIAPNTAVGVTWSSGRRFRSEFNRSMVNSDTYLIDLITVL